MSHGIVSGGVVSRMGVLFGETTDFRRHYYPEIKYSSVTPITAVRLCNSTLIEAPKGRTTLETFSSFEIARWHCVFPHRFTGFCQQDDTK